MSFRIQRCNLGEKVILPKTKDLYDLRFWLRKFQCRAFDVETKSMEFVSKKFKSRAREGFNIVFKLFTRQD